MGWTCSCDEELKECVQIVSEETSWKTTIWMTEVSGGHN
jgi:hypothetical protein